MKQIILCCIFCTFVFLAGIAQSKDPEYKNMSAAAEQFLQSLAADQKTKAQCIRDTIERYNWHYIPKDDRKGISLNELNTAQKNAALALLHTTLSDKGYTSVIAITQLEPVLKAIENRPADDHFRDPGKYFFSIFGHPGKDSTWGWRLEGHHISFNFSAADNRLVSGTPSFLGSNPAIVLA